MHGYQIRNAEIAIVGNHLRRAIATALMVPSISTVNIGCHSRRPRRAGIGNDIRITDVVVTTKTGTATPFNGSPLPGDSEKLTPCGIPVPVVEVVAGFAQQWQNRSRCKNIPRNCTAG